MSALNNKVEWCLKKAEKELKESGIHRGLIRIKPDMELARAYIRKAEHNLKAVIDFKRAGYSDWSAPAAFYSIYHSFLGIITKSGYESRNQECTFALINHLINEGKISINKSLVKEVFNLNPESAQESPTVISVREAKQYGVSLTLEDESFKKLLETAKEILDKSKEIIEG